MKTRTLLAGLGLSVALTVGVAGTAAAQSALPAPSPAAQGARKEFVCSHQDQIKDLLSQRKALLGSRLALLKDARQSAVRCRRRRAWWRGSTSRGSRR